MSKLSHKKISEIPKSIQFKYNIFDNPKNIVKKGYFESAIENSLQENQDVNNNTSFTVSTAPKSKNKEIYLSSRLSTTQLYGNKNTFLNEKIMKFNEIKNDDVEVFKSYIKSESKEIKNHNESVLIKTEIPESEIICEKKNEIIQYEKPEIFFTEPDYSKQEEIILREESKTVFTIDSQRNGLHDLIFEANRNIEFTSEKKSFFQEESSNRMHDFILNCLFINDLKKADELLEEISYEQLNRIDNQGNNLLSIAVKLAKKNKNMTGIIKKMLQLGANPNISDNNDWTILDEAISQGNIPITIFLFDIKKQIKQHKLIKEEEKFMALLETIPNFYVEMKWDFDSSIIPFINKLAPSDTFKIWKYKNSLRLDYSLVGFNGIKPKKREMSLIFNPNESIINRNDVKKFHSSCFLKRFWLVNKSKKIFTNPLQEIDLEEKKKVISDMLLSQPIQGKFNITKCVFSKSKNWLGNNKSSQNISNWNCQRFDFTLFYDYFIILKQKNDFCETYEEYINKENYLKFPEMKKCNSDLDETPGMKKNKENKKNDNNFNLNKIDWFSFVKKQKKSIQKKICLQVWISEQFPLHFRDIVTVFNYLSNGSEMISKLNQVLKSEEIQNLFMNSNNFPVKIQIPINYSIKSNITFTHFEFLDKKNYNYDSLFSISDQYKYTDRKLAQKILERTKKRVLLGNLLI